jgi:nucleoside-diphosphate-sugar epimerase
MKVFLTGGTGFIGQHLTIALMARGWSITALVRNPDTPQAQGLSKIGAQLSTGDITDRESMRAAMSGSAIVVHNAGHYEMGMDKAGKQRMHAINVTGTDNVLSLAHELEIKRTIYVSTIQVFGETGSQPRDETFKRQAPCRTTYERSKTDAHEIALQHQKHGLPLIIVCPHAVIGTNDHSIWGYLLRMYINRIMPPFGWSPHSVFACIYIDDLAEGPIQRILGLPAFISRESVAASATNWHYVNEKAKRELGWTHRSAEAMWNATFEGELKLLSKRMGQNLVQRLKPLESVD